MIETFDDFDSTQSISVNSQKPFALREDTSEEGTLEWLNQNFDMMEQRAQSRLISYQRWSLMYKGIHWRDLGIRSGDQRLGGNSQNTERKPKMVDNFIKEFIDSKVSQMARFGTSFTAIPWNNEISDQNSAKACEKLLKARADEIDFDKLQRDCDKIKYKYGTVFPFVVWDENEGPDAPEFEKLKELYEGDIPKEILKKLKGKSTKVGDVKCYAQTPDRIFPELDRETWDKVKHVDEISWENIHELRAEYPKKEILENQRNYYDYSNHEVTKPADTVQVRKFYHPPSTHLPNGIFIKYTDSAILEMMDYPFKHGKFPFIVDKDIEIENELFGRPSITQIEQMQRQYNNIASSQARDLGVGSAPKWVVPKGAVDFRTVNNEFTMVEFRGPVPPQLVKGNPISNDGIVIQDRMEKRMGRHMKVYDISRGEVPSGVTANSALRFLDEQESQVLADDERARKRRVLQTYKKMIQVMAQYYTAEDGRTLRTLGKNNQYQIESMKRADFTKVYDVQLQNTSALPDTKTGRIAAIIDLNTATQTDPVFGRADIVNMLDLGTDEAFTEEATYSLDCAKMMLEKMLNGEEVPDPEMHDDLIVYYTTMWRAKESYQFKMTVPQETKDYVYGYIKTLEGLIFLKSQRNQKLAMEVSNLDYFPSFFELPEVEPQITPEEANIQQNKAIMETQKMENAKQDIETAKQQGA